MFPHKAIFHIGSLGVYPYGVCMAVGIIACFAFLAFTMWYKKFNETSSDAVIFIGIFGTGFGIFSALLFQSFYNFLAHPSAGFHLGGMTFLGGLLGGVVGFVGVWNLYMFVVRPRTKIEWLKKPMNATLTDALPFIPIGIAIAHAFGRLGCFFAGCCSGNPTDAWYGIACSDRFGGLAGGVKVVPIQLFEMIFLFCLAAIMALLYFKFKFNYNFAAYAIGYAVWRFIIEFFRGDDRGGVSDALLTPSQIMSIVMILCGIGYIFAQYYVFRRLMKHPELQKEEAAEHKEEIVETQEN